MDQERFDRIARALGASGTRRAGLRAALGALGLLAGGAVAAEAKGDRRRKGRNDGPAAGKRKHECGPDAPCPTGYDCVKQGRKRRCACSTGVVCNGACCPTGQVCQDGACTVPTTCIAPGEPCKGTGKPCCDGRTCASGQGGRDDVACYVHKTGACQSTADCVYGTACLDGRCGFDVPAPAALGASCNPDVGQLCADPDAVCTAYTRAGAPSGSYCSLPLEYTCSGDPDCTCYTCGYANGSLDLAATADRGASVEPELPRLACCGPEGYACTSDRNCCLGTTCVNGSCQAVCDVCASGCPFTTIKDAFFGMPAGSTIRIAPGEYAGNENRIELFSNTAKDMTLVRCGDEGVVTWVRPAGDETVKVQYQTNAGAPDLSLAFVGLDFVGHPTSSSSRELFALGGRDAGVNRTMLLDCRVAGNNTQAIDINPRNELTVVGCTFEDTDAGNEDGAAIYSNGTVTVHRTLFRNNRTGGDGGALYQSANRPVRISDSVCENNRANDFGGCIYVQQGTITLRNVTMRGNYGEEGGGAVYVHTGNGGLVFEGTTAATGNSVRGNSFDWGSGILCFGNDCAARIGGTTPANVSGNTPAERNCSIKVPDSFTFYAVDCATWCLPAGTPVSNTSFDCAICCSGSCSGNVCA